MSGATRSHAVEAFCACCALLLLCGCAVATVSGQEREGEEPVLEIWFSIAAPSEARDELIRGLGRELARTPQRHRARFFDAAESLGRQSLDGQSLDGYDRANVLALLEVVFSEGGDDSDLTIGISHADDLVSPGWLVHAVLRAADTVRVRGSVADARSSWTGQLVARSTRRLPASSGDQALAAGLPAVVLRLPGAVFEPGGEAALRDASRVLAAIARRLDGLDGPPVFEDEYLVAAGRVWLRRDLYWLCLGLWLVLFWRGRALRSKRQFKGGGREFRWLFLVAALVAPVFASILLALPAAVAAWRPRVRWLALVALAPAILYAIRLSVVLLGGAHLTIDAVPAVLVTAALGIFAWTSLAPGQQAAPSEVEVD